MRCILDFQKVGDQFIKTGMQTAMLGLTYSMMKDSMRGYGGCCCNSVFGGGYGMMPMYNYGMPYGMGMGMGMGFGGNIFSMPMMGMQNPFMMYNQMYSPMSWMQIFKGNSSAFTPQKMNNPRAEAVSADQDTAHGKKLAQETKAMFDSEGRVISGKEYKFVSDDWMELNNCTDRTAEEDAVLDESYKNAVMEIAKSYVAEIDKFGGRKGDGQITIEEFADYTVANACSDGKKVSNQEEQKMINAAKVMFNKLDLNKDGVIDWKEMSAMIHAADTEQVDGKGNKGKQNGIISAEDLNILDSELMDANSNQADFKLQNSYNKLYKNG